MQTRTCPLGLSNVLEFAGSQQQLAAMYRKVCRYEFRHPVRILRDRGCDGQAVSYDVSELGMGLFTPFECDVGERVCVRMTIPDVGTLEQSAIVSRVRQLARGLWEIGCLFRNWASDDMPDQDWPRARVA